MEFIQVSSFQGSKEKALLRLKKTLKEEGFDNLSELDISGPESEESSTLVTAASTKLISDFYKSDPEAGILATTNFVVKSDGKQTQIQFINPEILTLIPEKSDLQKLVKNVRSSIEEAVKNANKALVTEKSTYESSKNSADVVETKVFELILKATEKLISEENLHERSDDILTLAKAYTAVASLQKTEEVELHLA